MCFHTLENGFIDVRVERIHAMVHYTGGPSWWCADINLFKRLPGSEFANVDASSGSNTYIIEYIKYFYFSIGRGRVVPYS